MGFSFLVWAVVVAVVAPHMCTISTSIKTAVDRSTAIMLNETQKVVDGIADALNIGSPRSDSVPCDVPISFSKPFRTHTNYKPTVEGIALDVVMEKLAEDYPREFYYWKLILGVLAAIWFVAVVGAGVTFCCFTKHDFLLL